MVPRGESESDRLAGAFRRGEPDAVQRVTGLVERIVAARGYGIPSADREDLAQLALAQIWEHAQDPEASSPQDFESFVCAVGHRRCIDWWRRRRPQVELDDAVPDRRPGPAGELLESERGRLARRAIATLGERCRELFYLRLALGMRAKEIARLQGRSDHAVRVSLSACLERARQALRRITAGEGDARGERER